MAITSAFMYASRALQALFAIVILGVDGFGISKFTSTTHPISLPYQQGDSYVTAGVPSVWGFLIFCAVWTILIILSSAAALKFDSSIIWAYIVAAAEGVAVISWFAGFIAAAVNVGGDTCSPELNKTSCNVVKAAVVFAALEWLLFVGTVTFVVKSIGGGKK